MELPLVGPWMPFLHSCANRLLVLLALALLVESKVLGLAPSGCLRASFFAAALLVGSTLLMQLLEGLVSGDSSSVPDMKVQSESGALRDGSVPWAVCSMRGWRGAMEDAHVVEALPHSLFPDTALFAVLDGHGGKEVSALASRLLKEEVEACGREILGGLDKTSSAAAPGSRPALLEKALEMALPRLDARMRAGFGSLGRLLPTAFHPFLFCGSTACVAGVDFSNRQVVVSNVGDSRAMLVKKGKAVALSEDHKPENPKEKKRIKAAGGQVIKTGPCHRVDGNLNLSRALGDFNLKANHLLPPEEQKISAFPDSMRTTFNGGPEELLILGCDGLFEKFSNQDVADFVWKRVGQGMAFDTIGQELLHACCARGLMGSPIEEGTDNETVIIVGLPRREDAATTAAAAAAATPAAVDGSPTAVVAAGADACEGTDDAQAQATVTAAREGSLDRQNGVARRSNSRE
eukprot:TRINITY_DN496_c0_g1_i1.p1 TRINITY_DN496_c0_g1~~TRINITY_DN496_c0_g1_i1.p1  ORF type:complete len:462 (-),score=109.48 TRINITY_DN496_c0_g1_i1:222-1607(-)